MGILDNIKNLTSISKEYNEDKQHEYRMDQIHKMIEERAKYGNEYVKIHKSFFNDDMGKKVIQDLINEGFRVLPPDPLSSFFNGNEDWDVSWASSNQE